MQGFQLVNGEQQFLDQNGNPLIGGFVYHYLPGTTTPSLTYQDPNLSTPNTNPIILDGAGRAIIWGNSFYRQVVTDQRGNLQWDQVVGNSISGGSGGGGGIGGVTQAIATDKTGDQIFNAGASSPLAFDTSTLGELSFTAYQFQYRRVEIGFTAQFLGPTAGAVKFRTTVQVSYDNGNTWSAVGSFLVGALVVDNVTSHNPTFRISDSFIDEGPSIPLTPTTILYRTLIQVLNDLENSSIQVFCATAKSESNYIMKVSNVADLLQG